MRGMVDPVDYAQPEVYDEVSTLFGYRLALVIPVAVMALPPMGKDFIAAAKISPDSKLAKSDCAICHVGRTPKLNPYGTDMKAAMAALNIKKVTPAVLAKIATKDSDKDGVKNMVEIKKDKAPGDPKIK